MAPYIEAIDSQQSLHFIVSKPLYFLGLIIWFMHNFREADKLRHLNLKIKNKDRA